MTSRRSFLNLTAGVIAAPFTGRVSIESSTEPNDATALNRDALALPLVNPSIVVTKSKRRLKLYSAGKVVREYRVGLGLSPIEDKVKAGDRRTPEGEFYICRKNSQSKFYLSLELSYPNKRHADRGLRDGLISRAQYNQIVAALDRKRVPLQNTHLGGELFIHGNGSRSDWTWGCVALEDKDVRELFDAVPAGTPVVIEH
jgi:murein L,D-transpeptidase YafK